MFFTIISIITIIIATYGIIFAIVVDRRLNKEMAKIGQETLSMMQEINADLRKMKNNLS